MEILNALKSIAQEQNAAFPQYAGHFDAYVLVRMKRTVHTKMGMAFMRGEMAIASPMTREGYRTVYSIRNRVDTSVPESSVSIVQ